MVPATPPAATPKPPPLCFPRPSSRSMRACQPELVAAGFRGRRCRLELRAAPLAELVCGGSHPAAAAPGWARPWQISIDLDIFLIFRSWLILIFRSWYFPMMFQLHNLIDLLFPRVAVPKH
jgi:hypothetical protein